MIYFQCNLSQGTGRTTAYIPARGAVVGKSVEIKDDLFTGRWRVDQVADKGISEDVLREKQARGRDPFGSISKRHA
jgi:hypothetical protein